MGSIDETVVVPGTTTTESSYDRAKEMKEFDESKTGVKGLVEAGITTIPKFFIHPPEDLADIKSVSNSLAIPIIDFSRLNCPNEHSNLVQELREAATKWGFFEMINTGIPQSVLDNVLEAIRAFHNQPLEEKAKLYWRSDEPMGVKYSTNNDLYRASAASWRDSLQVWGYAEPFPVADIPEICRKEVIEFTKAATGAAEVVMELLAEGLGLERTKFSDLTFLGSELFVGHCYPPCPQPDLTLGITSHTDPGVLTLLMPNHVPGLQVKHGDSWVDVKPLKGGLIVNIGDFLQVASNDIYKSVQHRVLANASNELRLSVAMFYNVKKWLGEGFGYYGPLPELITPETPAKFRNFTKEEFKANFFGKSLGYKNLVDAVKINN